jgi:putative flippase GtrA
MKLMEKLQTPEARKKLRYAGVSVVFVPLGQISIQLLVRLVFNGSFTKSSIANAVILTPPNFLANKYFVWKDKGKDNVRTQAVVFWVAAMLGLAFATGLTWLVERAVAGNTSLFESGAVFLAQLVGFGIVWVFRYLVLDKWLFKATNDSAEPTADQLLALHSNLPI